MFKKQLAIVCLIGIVLITISFESGRLLEKKLTAQETYKIDQALLSLLMQPTDFNSGDVDWSSYNYSQMLTFPEVGNGVQLGTERAFAGLGGKHPGTQSFFTVEHNILRYTNKKAPQTTELDTYYFGGSNQQTTSPLNLTLDDKSTGFCVIYDYPPAVKCFIESKYDEIISTLSILSSEGFDKDQAASIIFRIIQKFYVRLAHSEFK
jgi:hypothetical protein